MRPPYFFRCCRDLIAVRWNPDLLPHGLIRLFPAFLPGEDQLKRAAHPIIAVAVDVCGFRVRFGQDNVEAAIKRLKLPREFAHIVTRVAIRPDPANSICVEVRRELETSLFPRKILQASKGTIESAKRRFSEGEVPGL